MPFDMAKLERRIKALEANRGASLRFGTVTEVSEADGTARVQLPDGQNMVSHPLRVMQPRSLKDKKQCFPDVGEPVACLFAGQGFEQGVVLGAIYSPKCASPNQSVAHDYIVYEDGTELWYDRKSHKLIAKVKGDAAIEAEGSASIRAAHNVLAESQKSITLKAPRINIAGKLSITDRDGRPGSGDLFGNYRIINGSLDVPNGDVIAGITRLRDHLHTGVESGPGSSGPPANGEQMGNSGLSEDDEREIIFARVTDIGDRYVRCMPDMVASEIERTLAQGNMRDYQGWLYLHEGMTKWLHGKGAAMPNDALHNGCQEPMWVEWDWLMQYKRFRTTVEKLKQTSNLFDLDAQKKLVSILQKDKESFTGKGKPFNHIFPKEDWKKWRSHEFRRISMNPSRFEILDEEALKGRDIKPDGLQVAVGRTAIYALASGKTQKNAKGTWEVVVTKVAFFIHDGFDFNGDQWLGNWACTADVEGTEYIEDIELKNGFFMPGIYIENKDFRQFRNNTGYGCDFRTVCIPEIVRTEVFSYDVS